MIYNILNLFAPIFVPIAPVIFFGWRVYTAVHETTHTLWLSVPAGVLTAFGLEAVGILAGHVGMTAWKRKDNQAAAIAACIMAIYVGIGTYELRGTIGAVVFWIAPLVYVLIALQELISNDKGRDDMILSFDLEQRALDNEAKRRQRYDVALAKISQPVRRISQSSQAVSTSGNSQEKTYTCACGWSTKKGSRSYNAHKRHCKTRLNGAG